MVFPDGHHEEGTSVADREKLSTDLTKLQVRTNVKPTINVLSMDQRIGASNYCMSSCVIYSRLFRLESACARCLAAAAPRTVVTDPFLRPTWGLAYRMPGSSAASTMNGIQMLRA